MEKFTTSELADLFNQHESRIDPSVSIHEVFTDSRTKVKQGLFVPIKGENFDAHDFIIQAIENGAVAALWGKEEIDDRIPQHFPLIIVDDTIEALQQLASFYRQKVNPNVVAITGSNGKTTTKELVAQVLSTKYKVTKTKGNLNNHIGLPLTILDMDLTTEVLVAEMGMSNFGEIELLSRIAKPDYALITNIGESHIEYLGSREGITKAKLEITSGLCEDGVLILDGDEPLLQNVYSFNVTYCGFQPDHDVYVDDVKQLNDSTAFRLNGEPYKIPLLGKHQAKNSAFAYAVGKALNVDEKRIKDALNYLQFPSMRFEQIVLPNGARLINDAYNASATSMIASLSVLKEMSGQTKIAVLGDILELGTFSKREHERVGNFIDEQIDIVFTYGEQSEHILNGLPSTFQGEKQHFTLKKSLKEALQKILSKDSIVLFKASRGMRLEDVIEQLTNA